MAPNLYKILTGNEIPSNIFSCNHRPLIAKGDASRDHDGVPMSDYLENPESYGPFLIPHFDAGPDLCFLISYKSTLIPVFVQLKLSNHVSRVKALATTDPLKFYTSKNYKRPKKYLSEYQNCINIIKKNYNGTYIGILIAYPKSWKSEKVTKTTTDGLTRWERVFDGAHKGEIFDDEHLNFLANIGIE